MFIMFVSFGRRCCWTHRILIDRLLFHKWPEEIIPIPNYPYYYMERNENKRDEQRITTAAVGRRNKLPSYGTVKYCAWKAHRVIWFYSSDQPTTSDNAGDTVGWLERKREKSRRYDDTDTATGISF
jgi:hypothetical protein